MVVTYYMKLFRTGADRHNGILMSVLLLVTETRINIFNIFKIYETIIINMQINFSCFIFEKNHYTISDLNMSIAADTSQNAEANEHGRLSFNELSKL